MTWPSLPHLVSPHQGHTSERAVGRGSPGEKATDSPIVTETIVSPALVLLPGAWKREQGEKAHELPQAVSICPSLAACLPARLPPACACRPEESAWAGGSEPRNSLNSWQEVSLGQSCHHNHHCCLGQGPGMANVYSSIPTHLKSFWLG